MAAFKDELNDAAVDAVGAAVATAWPDFALAAFTRQAKRGLDRLELKARVLHMIEALHAHLPADPARSFPILTEALEQELPAFVAWPLIDYVGEHGMEHAELSLQTLPRMTRHFSAEFAVRPFLIRHESLALQHMEQWAEHECEHVRRLASEGSRPILPWGIRLPELLAAPEKARPILAKLVQDPSEYVRRSVANHMNDISRNHPDWMLDRLQEWGGMGLPWARHAMRTLIKQGHPRVWPMLGYRVDLPLTAELRLSPQSLRMGEELQLELQLSCAPMADDADPHPVAVDYILHLVRARGQRNAKVFKWRTAELLPGKVQSFRKKHSFKAVTTRRYYPGTHRLEVQVNGRVLAGADFELWES